MGGKHITDHKFFGGAGSPKFPDGPHKVAQETSAEGFGALSHYEDTSSTIKSQQQMAKTKVHGHPHKAGTRN